MKYYLALFLTTSFIFPLWGEPIYLLDSSLSRFEHWLGTPHTSVTGLPEGTIKSPNGKDGTPLGKTKTTKKIFTTENSNGEVILRISGEIYAALTTKDSFENYHLSAQFKWGNQKWEPRLKLKKDSGILYHCYGEDGAFWNVWKTGLEYQVQESDIGDFISLSGNSATPRRSGPEVDILGDTLINKAGKTKLQYNPVSSQLLPQGGYIHASADIESPHGEWNQIDLYVVGADAVHCINGEVVMILKNARLPDGSPLTKGQLQIQSEGAECFYKALALRPLTEFPAHLKKHLPE